MKNGTKLQCAGWLILAASVGALRYCNLSLTDCPPFVRCLLLAVSIICMTMIMLGFNLNRNSGFSGIAALFKTLSKRQLLLLAGWSLMVLSMILSMLTGNSSFLIAAVLPGNGCIILACTWSLMQTESKAREDLKKRKQLLKMYREVKKQMENMPDTEGWTDTVLPSPDQTGGIETVLPGPDIPGGTDTGLSAAKEPDSRTCPICGSVHRKSDMIYIDGLFYCEACVEDMT